MHVLVINQFFWPDTAATGQLLTDVARALDPAVNPVTALCGISDYGVVDSVSRPSVNILRSRGSSFSRSKIGRLRSYASFFGRAAIQGLRVPQPGLVLTLTTPPLTSLLGNLLKTVRGCRHYIWEMDVYPDIATDLGVVRRGSIPARVVGALADWSRRHADGIIVLGEDMKDRLRAHGIPEHKLHVAENWADSDEIVPLPFPAGPLVIHYSGNLGLAHDVETIMGALRQLGSDERFRFVFAGDGARRAAMETFCRDQNLRTVSFQPYSSRADLGRNLGSGHVGLVTQLPETCGSVVPSKTYGIMAAGRPLLYIGPRGGTPARIIEKYRCGWQIDPGDVTALTAILERLYADRNLIREAGARGRAAFEKNYDRSVGVARIATILGLEAVTPA
ncbi:MAG: glycosyltransferase family 4 protein [Acidobacteriota bacterium]|nr:glycosyltransferase family 4 protein [Acidobacteriota bacterium]